MTGAADTAHGPLLLLDTHVLVWSIENSPKLGRAIKGILNEAARQRRISISAITPWEIALLVSKNRLELYRDVLEWMRDALAMPGVSLVPLEPEIAVESTRLPWEIHPDPADRILVATARRLGATLVTADGALLEFSVKGYFKTLDARV